MGYHQGNFGKADLHAIRAFGRGEGPDMLVYARGATLAGSGPVAGAVRGLLDAGLARSNFRRGADGVGEYVITRRTGARLPKRPVRARGPQLDEIEKAVLRLLRRYARAGAELPTNRSIAARCGCKNRHDASYRIRKLAGFGLIRIEITGETRTAKLPASDGEARSANMPALVGEGECSSLQD